MFVMKQESLIQYRIQNLKKFLRWIVSLCTHYIEDSKSRIRKFWHIYYYDDGNWFLYIIAGKSRDFKIVLRINEDGGKLFSGAPYQQEVVYRTASILINGIPGTAILELGYKSYGKSLLLVFYLFIYSSWEVLKVGYMISKTCFTGKSQFTIYLQGN